MNNKIMEQDASKAIQQNICCLIDDGIRCRKIAGNASYSKRIQNIVSQHKLNLKADQSTCHHTYICDYHKAIIQSVRSELKRKQCNGNPVEAKIPDVNLNCLHINTLRRYRRFFNIQTKPGMNKSELADALTEHFKTIPVDEKEVISLFVYSVKTHANKLDNKEDNCSNSNVGSSSSNTDGISPDNC